MRNPFVKYFFDKRNVPKTDISASVYAASIVKMTRYAASIVTMRSSGHKYEFRTRVLLMN